LSKPIPVARPGSDEWPAAIDTIPSPPRALYYNGDISILARPCVSIVGSRKHTSYGARVARELASALASAGACIVSGMAFGIDAIAHRAALDADGLTAAVLGTGIDVVYPRGHADLYAEIAGQGVVISEMEPGVGPFRGCFPRRNRIIAGLSRLTIVVEAGDKSGSLITATLAAEFGRDVAAVPGPIDSPQSAGSNKLLRDGAHVIASIDDALALAVLAPARTAPRSLTPLGDDEAAVWDAVAQYAVTTTDEVITHTGWPASRALAALSRLEIQGLLECSAVGTIARL
jgi:DNA processing protein